MTRKGKLVKAPAGPTEQPTDGFSIEKLPIDCCPKLKKLVADFKQAHQAFCYNLLQATYRLIHDARKIGDLLLKMKQEGGFKSKRQLHGWLELQAEVSIPQPTFYRYIQAAEDFQKVEVIHGTKMLTEITSNKVLKMLANPKAQIEPQVFGWEGRDGTFTKGDWTIRNHNGTKHLWEAHNSKGEQGFVMGSLKDIIEAVQSRIDMPTNPNIKPAVEVTQQAHSAVDAQDAMIEGGDDSDPNDEDDEPPQRQQPAPEPTTPGIIYLHHDCHGFSVEGNALKCLDHQGRTVILVAPKRYRMSEMLRELLTEAVDNAESKPTKQGRAAK
jgi:hypothetical protein